MSDQFFTENENFKTESDLDSTVLVEDGVVWDQEEVQIALSYSNNCEETLTENNNDGYLTANEGSNDTQYFSVLETTSEPILNELSDMVAGNDAEVTDDQPAVSSICTIGGQPDIYRIVGSDDLYAFEVAYDEEGNTQRFRYRLSLNENGEYESVPESIELLPLENEPAHESPAAVQEEQEAEPEVPRPLKVFVKQENENETNVAEESSDELQVNEDESEEPYVEETPNPHIESKSGIIERSLLSINKMETSCKSEEPNMAFEASLLEHADVSLPTNDVHPPIEDELPSSIHNSGVSADNFRQACAEISDQNITDSSQGADTRREPQQRNYQRLLIGKSQDSHEATAASAIQGVGMLCINESYDNSQDAVESVLSEESEDHFESTNIHNMSYIDDLNENESDTDDYQIVDGVHVTGDTEAHEDTSHIIETFLQRDSLQHQILKIQQQIPVLQSTVVGDDKLKEMVVNNHFNKANKGVTYYVVKHPEKENVATIAGHQPITSKVVKANPRSVLKSSYLYYEQKKENAKPVMQKIEKKVLKNNKELLQARVFNNYIAKTTILHAPVRQQRLPRKQTIKPVVRADESISFQEVVVSSNGFIETSEDGVVKSKVPLKPTEIVQLSDSDDDYDPKKEHKRKKRQKKRKSKVPEIVISDTEDESVSDENVVQIDLSDSDYENDDKSNDHQSSDTTAASSAPRTSRKSSRTASEGKNDKQSNSDPSQSTSNEGDSGAKKKRGRPPKRRNSATDETSVTDEGSSSSSKKQRRNTKDSIESSESSGNKSEETASTTDLDIQDIKTKWKCTKCPKTFPSQGSLKTHMQYHNFHETNSRNLRQSTNKPEEDAFKKPESTAPLIKNKYECSRCGEAFKNDFLLTRHAKAHGGASKNLECSICKKIFIDRALLINHKRTHVKEQMFKATSLPRHSPKAASSVRLKSTKSPPKKSDHFKCNFCTRVFTSLPLLNAHSRSHKRFTCSSCAATFISKLTLEDHIRHNCVKQSKSPTRRLSLKTRKSFLAPPQRVSKRISLRRSVGKKGNISGTNNSSSSDGERRRLGASLKCDNCTMKFHTYKALFSHKVVQHGLSTPDKSILGNSNRKTFHKERGTHDAVPASERLRNAFAGIAAKQAK